MPSQIQALASAIRFQLPKTRGKTWRHYRDLPLAQKGLMSLFQSLGMVGLHRRRASVDMLKTCPCKNGMFKKPKICSANCAIHEHGVKHEKPCAIRAFSPKLQAVRTPPPCGKTGTLMLKSKASCLASEYLPPELGPGQLVFDSCKFACRICVDLKWLGPPQAVLW